MKKFGIKGKIMTLAVLPLLIVFVILSFLFTEILYNTNVREIKSELKSTCYVISELTLTSNRAGSLYRYMKDIGCEEHFAQIKRTTGIDVTFFENDIRRITTIQNKDGKYAVGTKVSDDVRSAIFGRQEDYFSENIDVNGQSYFGYYMPIKSETGMVMGMVFAGKSTKQVRMAVRRSVSVTFGITLLIILFVTIISILVTTRMVKAVNSAAVLLDRISGGDTGCEADSDLISRTDEIGKMGRAAVILRDELKSLISTDPLTGLFNRRFCNIRLNEMFDQAQDGREFVVVLGDIDFFKKFNDNYGHSVGDEVLKGIAAILRDNVGKKGIVSRWGGEEFLIAFGGLAYSECTAVMNAIMDDIHAYRCHCDGGEIPVTMTFGIERFSDEMTVDALINSADKNLYFGKENGRDRLVESADIAAG